MEFTIRHQASGDEATAEGVEAALTAAHTLAHDHCEHTGAPLRYSRSCISILTQDGFYAGLITEAARTGERTLDPNAGVL